MYNGIGLQTPRGSGTNGHVQRNWAFVRPGKVDSISFKTEEDISKLDFALNRQPNQEILDHERKRKIEVKCAEFEEILEKQGLDADNIKIKIDHYRVKLIGQAKGELPKDEFGRVNVRETHQIAEAQQEKNAKLREAFGISEYFVDGTSFDPNRKTRDAVGTSTTSKAELLAKNQAEMKNDSKYALVRTPSREKDVENINKSSSKNKRKHRSRSSPDRKGGKKKKSKKHKKERSKKGHKKRNKGANSEPSMNSDSEHDLNDFETEVKKRKKAKKDKKKRNKKKQRESSIDQSASIEQSPHLHNRKESRQQPLSGTSQDENEHKSIKDRVKQTKDGQISRYDTLNKMSERKAETSRTTIRKRPSRLSRSVSPKLSKKDQSKILQSQIEERPRHNEKIIATQAERSQFTNDTDCSRQKARSKERGQQEILGKRGKKDTNTNEKERLKRIKVKERKYSSQSSRSRSHTPDQNRKDLSLESKRYNKNQSQNTSKTLKTSPSRSSLYQERKCSIEREHYDRRRSLVRSKSPVDKIVKKKDSNQTRRRSNPFRSGNIHRRRSNSPHSHGNAFPYYDNRYRYDKRRRSFSQSPDRSRQQSSQRRELYSPGKQNVCAKINPDACNESAGAVSSKLQVKDRRTFKRKSSSQQRESNRERNKKSDDSPTACGNNDIVSKMNSEDMLVKIDSRLPFAEKSCSVDDNNRRTCHSPYAEDTLRSTVKKVISSTRSAEPSRKRGSHKKSLLPAVKVRKESPYNSNSESSSLSYSPAQREPERYLALLEEIKKEAKEKAEPFKNKVYPDVETLKTHQSKSKDRRLSQIVHPQPSVHLHSPNESDCSESENEELRNRHVEQFIEAIVNEKKEETQKVPEKDMKMLEVLKSGIAAKAKEKIKTAKMATELSPKSIFSSSTSLNTFIATTQSKGISIIPTINSGPDPYAESHLTSIIRSNITSVDCSSKNPESRSSQHDQSNNIQKSTIVIKPFKISELQPLTQSSGLHLKDNTLMETIIPKVTNDPGVAASPAAVTAKTGSSRSRSRSKYASSGNESRTDSRASSRSSSTDSSSSRSRSRSSRYSQSSQSRSSSFASTPVRSKSRSRSPSIPRRRGSPSFLDRRRITSARKRPIPYHRPTPSTMSSGDSSCGSKCSSPQSYHSLSKSRSPPNPF